MITISVVIFVHQGYLDCTTPYEYSPFLLEIYGKTGEGKMCGFLVSEACVFLIFWCLWSTTQKKAFQFYTVHYSDIISVIISSEFNEWLVRYRKSANKTHDDENERKFNDRTNNGKYAWLISNEYARVVVLFIAVKSEVLTVA